MYATDAHPLWTAAAAMSVGDAEAQRALEGLGGGRVLTVEADLTEPAAADRVVDTAASAWGRIDILVNNSGANWGASPEDYPLEGWQKVMETNMTGAFLFTQIAGRVMIRQKSGSIINIASIMGIIGTESEVADAVAYSASKGALIIFTKDLAAKWAKHNIRVNAIAPGWFPTAFRRR